MARDVRLVFDRSLARLADSLWGAPAAEITGRLVLSAMKREIPVSTEGSYGRPRGYARSRLQVLGRGRGIDGHYVDVGTDATTPDGTSYPTLLEYGTKPHEIRSHGNYPLRNRRRGQIFGRVVQHPGTKPNPWAARAAQYVNGLRIQ